MANNYFQFKQFRIEQAACAMKVSTDACVLGAVVDISHAKRILDIGTGTGLLALMAAQRNPGAQIEAIEIDLAAAAQAAANAAACSWSHRLHIRALSLSAYAATQPDSFDHILCNPPFFRHSLRSPDDRRTTARHAAEDTLSFGELAGFAAAHLTPAGRLTVLLPPAEMQEFVRTAHQAGLYSITQLVLRHRAGSKPLRCITAFGLTPQPMQQTELTMRAAADDSLYSAEFSALLQPFYLAL
ncbi:methyltransferase [Hymenobacter sp. BT18]|uniref:tRNA1(Val) (adenine(37)-N6)-methyltransferase n=1 Tax=Hymenobacter sp. BT18 TaxID=2835648 RepID=UPI00143E1C07|nr:methyltransferase [Hymenobacter sp. BT18]QIX63208.1 methyltransferase [Hymenobacter sp. BT18]